MFNVHITSLQGYIFCKNYGGGGEMAAGKKMNTEGFGKKLKRRKKEKDGLKTA